MSNETSSLDGKKSISDQVILQEVKNGEQVDEVHEADYSEEQYKKILNKIDWYLMPLMWVAYGVQQADKTGISTQALFNFRQDNHLVGQQYSWKVVVVCFSLLSTIFYLSYMVCEFPMSFVMQRVSVGKTMSLLMLLWGIVVLCTAFTHNFAGLMVLRALQGLFECTISPSYLLIIGTWYKTSEHASRSIIWGTANAGFGIIVSLCMYGIGDSATKHQSGLAAWKGISFFLGGTTILLSIFCWFLLGTPREVTWVSSEERRISQARIVANRTGTDHHKRRWKRDQVLEAFMDPSTWFLFCSVVLAGLPNGGITSFGSLVYTSFGFTPLQTILYDIPREIASIIWFLLVGYLCRFPRTRFWLMLFSILPGFIGLVALSLLPDLPSYRWIKFGMYFMTATNNINGLLLWMHVPSNVGGRTKKSAVSSIMFIAYCVGNAGGSQFFLAKDAPRYIPALIACSICLGLEFVFILTWRFYLAYQNYSRDKAAEAAGLNSEQVKELGAINGENDLTDRQNPHFRYDY